MEKVVIGNAELYCGDCEEAMAEMPDNAFDLAIVDPPYGLGSKLTSGGGSKGWFKRTESGAEKWDVAPPPQYFEEMMRVSVNQIIWGSNYFTLPPSRGIIAWDKLKEHDKNSSHWECAWTSFDRIARIFRYCNNGGFVQKEAKIHPTQKPVALYAWLLLNYAESGQSILDTHLGSGSSVIACLDMGFPITAYEIDQEYFDAACERIYRSQQQLKLEL